MNLAFSKYHGTGNDFILLDNRQKIYPSLTSERVAFLCDRHIGIGADGLILIQEHPRLDFSMRYFNADGRESSMCGNGGRCVTAFARKLGIIQKEAHFEAADGLHYSKVLEKGILLRMKNVDNLVEMEEGLWLDTGSPHLVVETTKPAEIDVFKEGRKIRYAEKWAGKGVNVDFVAVDEEAVIARTYERGVEDETLSCGTGAIASAIYAVRNRKDGSYSLPVHMPGGILQVHFQKNETLYEDVYLEGPATFVFQGTIQL